MIVYPHCLFSLAHALLVRAFLLIAYTLSDKGPKIKYFFQ